MKWYNPINLLPSGVRNTWFPGISGFGSPDKNAKLYSNIENNAKNLNRYRAPYQVIRLKIDTSYWRSAVAEMERPLSSLPYRVQCQTMYLDTVLNGHVDSCMRKRKNLTLLKKYHICDEFGQTDDQATAILQTGWFQLLREYIADALYYGYSLITLGDLIDGGFPNLQITRRTDVSPDRLCLSTMPYIPTGINFNDPNYVSENGERPYDWCLWVPTASENGVSVCGYGLLYKVSRYEIIMRSLSEFNTDYIERFGMPTVVIQTIDNSEEERGRAQEAAEKLAANSYLILNKGDDFEFESNNDAGTGWKSYDNLEGRCKKFISTMILGHEDGLSSSSGKMTKDDDESPAAKALIECETIDCNFEENIINGVLLPKLIKLGFKIPVGKKYKIKNNAEAYEENENKASRANRWATVAQTLSTAGLKVDEKEFTELSGITVTEAPPPITPSFSPSVKDKLNKTYA